MFIKFYKDRCLFKKNLEKKATRRVILNCLLKVLPKKVLKLNFISDDKFNYEMLEKKMKISNKIIDPLTKIEVNLFK